VVGDDGVDDGRHGGDGEPHRETQPPPASATPDNGENGADSSANKGKPSSRYWSIVKEVLEAVSLIAVIATMIFVGLQWKEMGRQYEIMSTQLKDARTAAADAKDDTNRALALAQQQATAAQHAAIGNLVQAMQAIRSTAATEQLAEATSNAAGASKDLAAAANEANIVSRQLVTATQQAGGINRNVARAYVFATDIKLIPIMSPFPPYKPLSWTANITWDNTGNTPTNDLVISANCWSAGLGAPIIGIGPAAAEQHPDAFDVSTITPDDKMLMKIPDTPHLIGPKSTKHSVGCVITAIEAAFNGIGGVLNFYYYSFGAARYKDVFGTPHRTDFCFVFRLTGNGEVDYMDPATVAKENLKPLGIETAFCQKHNCADEECDAAPLRLAPPPEPAKPPG